jgi:hypothetical protein
MPQNHILNLQNCCWLHERKKTSQKHLVATHGIEKLVRANALKFCKIEQNLDCLIKHSIDCLIKQPRETSDC